MLILLPNKTIVNGEISIFDKKLLDFPKFIDTFYAYLNKKYIFAIYMSDASVHALSSILVIFMIYLIQITIVDVIFSIGGNYLGI